jgi:hypothetical protein
MNNGNPGRPEYPEEQYQKWFDDLAPFFKLGETLNAAIDDAGLQQHRTTLYEKARLSDWFSDKMESLQAIPGKLANNILVKRLMLVDEKIKQGLPVTEEEMRDVRFIAEKHRSSQPYFVNRQEVAQVDPGKIGLILDDLEATKTDYGNFSEALSNQIENKHQAPTQSPS